jgi:hypothetical protein
LLKNKDLLAEVVVDILVEGYSKEVIDTMNFAPVVRLSWGGDDKRLSNLFLGPAILTRPVNPTRN